MRFTGRVAFVTGAASGLGRGIAAGFAQEGAAVIVADRDAEQGAAVAREISQAGGIARFVELDVSSEKSWRSAIDDTLGTHATIDVLINNAGISGTRYRDILDIEQWSKLMQTNADGPFLGTHFIAPVMVAAQKGVIINMSSISGVVAQHDMHVAYNAAKGAVRLLTKSTAIQFGRHGIRCNSVHPGVMPPMQTSGNTADPEVRGQMLKRVPLGRSGRTEEVVRPVLFLASDEASYITGAELHVDGGFLAN